MNRWVHVKQGPQEAYKLKVLMEHQVYSNILLRIYHVAVCSTQSRIN
jgi:hypothetical protein